MNLSETTAETIGQALIHRRDYCQQKLIELQQVSDPAAAKHVTYWQAELAAVLAAREEWRAARHRG